MTTSATTGRSTDAVPGLPDGFVVRLNEHVRAYDGGRTLVGGAPTRVVYLTATATRLLADRTLLVHDRVTRALADRLLENGMADPVVSRLPDLGEPAGKLTVVVPVRDRCTQLDRLLASVGGRHQVVVVDDCSHMPAAVAAVAARHDARLVRLPDNVGPAAARNEGLRHVTTPFVAFVDSDVVLEPDTVRLLLRQFHDPRVALAAPRITGLPAAGGTSWVARYEATRSSLDLGTRPAAVRPRSPVSWVPSACLVARVAALGDHVGAFDARLRVAEDVDLGWRLVARGWRVRYEPAARVSHEHRTGLRSWWRRKAFYGTGAHPLAERHGLDAAPAVLAPWSVVVVSALLAQRRWSVPAAAAVSAGVALRLSRRVGRSGSPLRLAVALTGNGVVAAGSQASALLLRHWWPLSLVGCCVSARMRRAVALVAVVDGAVEYARARAELDPVRFVLARRLDDLAYGAGVWSSAVRARSARSLLPDVRRNRAQRPPADGRRAQTHACGVPVASSARSSGINGSGPASWSGSAGR